MQWALVFRVAWFATSLTVLCSCFYDLGYQAAAERHYRTCEFLHMKKERIENKV